ncbi:MAG TPA: ribose ABC transporter permease [Clostridiales bacterium]|nr:ribose ABC transporter permease [Clostridiales bacterium]
MEKVKKSTSGGWWQRFSREYSIVLITIGVIIAAVIAVTIKFGDPTKFWDGQNFINILRANTVTGIIAFGMAFVIVSGNIDLSVGSQLVFVGLLMFNVLNATGSIPLAILVAVLFSSALSIGAGFIVTKGRVPSFILTLGLQYVYRSLSIFAMSSGGVTGDVAEFKLISNTELGGVFPLPIIYFFIVFAVYFYISKYTVLGRRIYAVGSNEQATKLSGINTNWVKMMAFALLGIAVAIAAVVEGSRMNSMNSSSSGDGYDLSCIAMAVVGGIAMEGGKGSMIGTLFGIVIMGIISNILTIMQMDVYLVNAVKGAIIIAAVLLQHKSKNN